MSAGYQSGEKLPSRIAESGHSSRQQKQPSLSVQILLLSLALFLLGTIVIYSGQTTDLSGLSKEELQILAENIQMQLNLTSSLLTKRATKSVLDQTWMRVIIGIGVFAVLNIVAVTAHHIVQKVRRSTFLYRSVEKVISPF